MATTTTTLPRAGDPQPAVFRDRSGLTFPTAIAAQPWPTFAEMRARFPLALLTVEAA